MGNCCYRGPRFGIANSAHRPAMVPNTGHAVAPIQWDVEKQTPSPGKMPMLNFPANAYALAAGWQTY
jgi:hypothetical protein